jgi:hypothetical protein
MKRCKAFIGAVLPAVVMFVLTAVIMTGCPNNPGDGNGDGDGTGPAVVSIAPADGAVDIGLDAAVTVVFDEAVDEASLGSGGIQLIRQGALVPGSIVLDGTGTEATFTPSIPHALYTRYTVSVTTAVQDTAGNALDASAQAVFHTVEGSWGAAEKLSGASTSCSDPQAAFEGLDGATAVWSINTSSTAAAYDTYSNYYDGSTWGEPLKRTSGNSSSTSSFPVIASNFNGFSLAAWLEQGINQGNNMQGTSVSGNSWGTTTIITDYSYTDETPVIGVSPGLEEIGFLLWEKNDGEIGDIWAARYDGAWSTSAEIPGMDEFGDEYAPDVAVDPEGNAFAVWIYEGNYVEPRLRRYDAASNAWDDTLIEFEQITPPLHPDSSVQITCDLNGNALAIWNLNNTDNYVKAQFYDASAGSWSNSVVVGEAGVTVDPNYTFPDVAFDAYGNAMAVWFQDQNIYVSRLEAGDWPNWTPENGSPLEAEGDASSSVPPKIVLDAEGNGAVAYAATVDNLSVVKVKRYRAGVDWAEWIGDETEATFTTFDSMNQGVQSLDGAVGPNGRMIAVWDDNGEIKAAVFK